MRWPYRRTPALGRNLPSSYEEGNRLFDERVRKAFPIGMDEADLIRKLRKQGFPKPKDPSIDGCKISTVRSGLICIHLWSVRWRADAGRIEDIWGVYGVVAP